MHTQVNHHITILEPTATGFSAYSPDVPGCVATGSNEADTRRNMADALAFHIEGLRDRGLPVPAPASSSHYVLVAAER
ncbi:type II toxin-antitoxin system HicB family antitoxin [Solidesulfovibrio sp.]